jgi:hypothetical protein
MATFKNARSVLGTAVTDVYEVPAGTTSIVIGCQAANVGTASVELGFWWTDDSAADAITYLADDVIIPARAAYEPVGGKLVLEAGDRLRGVSEAASGIEVTVSVLELS